MGAGSSTSRGSRTPGRWRGPGPPRAGRVHAARRRARPAGVLRQRHQPGAPVRHGTDGRVPQGRAGPPDRARRRAGRERGAEGNEGRCDLAAHRRSGRDGRGPATPVQTRRGGSIRGVRRPGPAPGAGGGRVLRARPRRPERPRRAPRPAAGVRRDAVEQAGLPVRRAPVAGRRSWPARPAGREEARPQPRLDAPEQRRRDLDARHLGVPLVRRLGPGVPLRPAGPDRHGVREAPAAPDDARMVHAPERPAAGLRVGVGRREPPGTRLGRLDDLRDGPCAARRRR